MMKVIVAAATVYCPVLWWCPLPESSFVTI